MISLNDSFKINGELISFRSVSDVVNLAFNGIETDNQPYKFIFEFIQKDATPGDGVK